MYADPRYRELPLRARTVAEVIELGHVLHDCWIDVERMIPERTGRKGRIVSFRFPVALDDSERKRLPDTDWELVVRNPRSIKIDDRALIAIYMVLKIDASPDRVVIECIEDLTIEIGVSSLDVSVEERVAR